MEKFENKDKSKKSAIKKITMEWVIPMAFAIVLASTVRGYALTRVDVDGPSMYKTLKDKDVMFEEKISLYTKDLKRGNIITFNSHDPKRPSYIKRIIAIAGDTIQVKEGKVYLNGKELKESYLSEGTTTQAGDFLHENAKFTVPKDTVFVMGDNRGISEDSRFFGPVRIKDVEGRVFMRVYPFDSIKLF